MDIIKALIFVAAFYKGIVCKPCDINCKWEYPKIEDQMDLSYDPCEDFFQYSCGNWSMPYSLRSLRATDTLSAIKADNKRILINHLKSKHGLNRNTFHSNISHLIENVTMFYDSCMETRFGTNVKQTIHTYTNILKGYKAFPFDEEGSIFDQENFQLEIISAELRRFGVQSFWRLLVRPNWQASDQPIFYIGALSSKFLKRSNNGSYDEDSVFLYETHIKYLMLDLGIKVRKAKEIAKELVDFEKQLLALAQDDEQSVILKEPSTVASLARQLPLTKLSLYFEHLLKDLTVPNDLVENLLIVADITYLRKLSEFLDSWSTSTIAKYLLVQLLIHFEVHMHEGDTLFDQTQYCLEQANKFMPQHLSALFLSLSYSDPLAYLHNAKNHLESIFENLKNHFANLLNATKVFERDAPETRTSNLDKLQGVRLILPNFQKEIACEIVSDYDKNLLTLSEKQSQREFLDVLEKMEIKNTDTLHLLSKKSYSPHDCGPLDVNAYYHLSLNAIEIPLGILRSPFYDEYFPTPQMYGSFVYIIAHELLHGFDYDGLNYDKAGNVASSWGAKSIIDYGIKAKCYLTRYSNDAVTLNENIADSEGLRLALDIFSNSSDFLNTRNESLKLFFIGFAQTWCGEFHTTLHASNSDRVNNAIANFIEFEEVFKCDETKLNSQEKCSIWRR